MTKKLSVTAIIPARMASSRFPGKPLKRICGLSMIEHVWRRTKMASLIDDVLIATCDKAIFDEARRFGARAVMTSPRHASCVDRIAEAAALCPADVIANVQGDTPLIHPEALDDLVRPFLDNSTVLFTDLIGPLVDPQDFASPNVVKVVITKDGMALYYSREPIPSSKKKPEGYAVPLYKQFGVNAYRRQALNDFSRWERTPLEITESVDMLRILENGAAVQTVVSPHPVIGVDTAADLDRTEKLMTQDAIFRVMADKKR